MARLFCFGLLIVTLLVAASLFCSDGPEDEATWAELILEPTPVNAQARDFLGPLPIDVTEQMSHLPGPPHAVSSPVRPADWPGALPDDELEDDAELEPVSWETSAAPGSGSPNVVATQYSYPQTAASTNSNQRYPAFAASNQYESHGTQPSTAGATPAVSAAPVQGNEVPPYAPPAAAYPQTPWTPGAAAPATSPPMNQPATSGEPYVPSVPPYAPQGTAPVTGGQAYGETGYRMSTEPVQQVVPPPVNDPIDNAQAVEGATILARVGNDVVLASEVMAHVNQVMQANEIPPEHEEEIRQRLTEQRLKQVIDTKMVLANFRRKMPAEGLKRFEEHLAGEFEENEINNRIKAAKVESRAQLDAWYRERGTSLEREKRAFIEHTMAMQWVQQQVKRDEEVTHDQMLRYYREHQDDFAITAKARWEQLSVGFGRERTKQEAYAMLAQMGNQVLGGVPFADVARAGSEGVTAEDGGQRDWTSQNSLVSVTLDRALFELPVGQLSPILEDRDAFHIIRVVERTPGGHVPFTEAQTEIKDQIREQRFREQRESFLEEIREETSYTTVFDDDDNKQSADAKNGAAVSRTY